MVLNQTSCSLYPTGDPLFKSQIHSFSLHTEEGQECVSLTILAKTFQLNCKCQPAGGATGKVMGSVKSLGFILGGDVCTKRSSSSYQNVCCVTQTKGNETVRSCYFASNQLVVEQETRVGTR